MAEAFNTCKKCIQKYYLNDENSLVLIFLADSRLNLVQTTCPNTVLSPDGEAPCGYTEFVFAPPKILWALLAEVGLKYQVLEDANEETKDAYKHFTSPEPDPEEVRTMLAKPYQEIVEHLTRKVIGQPRAISQLTRALKIAQAGLRDADKALGVFLFAGPTGTGKSEMAKALAEAIHDDPNAICRVDCNLLTESHTAAALTGSPPGYVGSAEGSTLLDKALIEGKAGRPGILVFEEIEKAHPRVFDTLLGIFDKGVLNMNNGKGKINFANTFVIMTSNVGARELATAAKGSRVGFAGPTGDTRHQLSGSERRSIVFRELDNCFKPEFINRLDDVVVFRWLDTEELDVIVDKFLEEFGTKLLLYPHFYNCADSARKFLVTKGFDIANGARPLKRAITKYVEDPIAELLVDGVSFDHVIFHIWHNEGDNKLSICYDEVPYITQGGGDDNAPQSEQ